MKKPEGWKNKRPDDPRRHADAARGRKSGRKEEIRLKDVMLAVAEGDFDENLDSLFQAIKQRDRIRRKSENLAAFIEFQPGDKIEFNARARPKYLVGLTGVVIGKAATKLIVEIEDTYGAQKWAGARVRVPASIVDKSYPGSSSTDTGDNLHIRP